MSTFQLILLSVLVVSTIAGYLLINHVPSLLHTPLMSGMNALSGITILGALFATSVAIKTNNEIIGYIFGSMAIILSMINVVGGFGVTNRMLKMFTKKGVKE